MSVPVIAVIALFIAVSGFFSIFEQALTNAKKTRLQMEAGSRSGGKAKRYDRALEAAEKPNMLLAAARTWAWTLRIFAAIFAGLHIGRLTEMRLPAEIAYTAALAAACLVFGDFLPRIITRREPERIAAATLPLITIFALPFRPLYFLGSKIFQRLQPEFSSKEGQTGITEDELRIALMEGEKSGIVESKERTMVEGVFYLGDRPLGAFMTHRSEVQWLDVNASPQDTLAKAMENREQRCFPVVDGVPDDIIGAVYLEDIVLDLHSGPPSGLRSIMRKPLFAPETMPALKAFESFKQGEGNFLFVMDEYGGFAGMVSLYSLMEKIVGELASPVKEEEQTVLMEDGSWLADGSLNIDDAAELLSLPGLADSGDYHTLAGFVLSIAGELPHAGDSFSHLGYKFTVLDMDGNRIDKIGIKKE